MNEVILFEGKARYLKDIKLLQFYDEFNELIFLMGVATF